MMRHFSESEAECQHDSSFATSRQRTRCNGCGKVFTPQDRSDLLNKVIDEALASPPDDTIQEG